MIPGKDGILIVGSEEKRGSTSTTATEDIDDDDDDHHHNVIQVLPGDAIAFYNYECNSSSSSSSKPTNKFVYKKSWRCLHSALPTKSEEKWIATNWIESELLSSKQFRNRDTKKLD